MNVLVDGLVVSYQDSGKKEGKPILFLHGWANDSSAFKPLRDELGKDYRCIALDLPGFGNSQTPKDAWDLPDFSDATLTFLDKIKIKPYAVICHSNGGVIAINMLSRGLIKPKKLVLLASSGIRGDQKLKKNVYKILAKPMKTGLALLPKSRRESIKRTLYGRIGSDYMVSENMKETFKKVVSYDIAGEAEKLKIPALLIYGGDDDSTPPEMGWKLHGLIKGSELKVLDGAGHFVQLDQPDKTRSYIESFLK